jgi:hypothetical protein
VLLSEHGENIPSQQTIEPLLSAANVANLFPKSADGKVPVDHLLAAPVRVGDKRGRHGGGANTQNVERDEAEAVVSSAAVAIRLIASRLPPPQPASE